MTDQTNSITQSRLTTPRAAAIAGILFSLLLSMGFFYWAPLVFPLWVLLISVHILLANLREPGNEGGTERQRRPEQRGFWREYPNERPQTLA